ARVSLPIGEAQAVLGETCLRVGCASFRCRDVSGFIGARDDSKARFDFLDSQRFIAELGDFRLDIRVAPLKFMAWQRRLPPCCRWALRRRRFDSRIPGARSFRPTKSPASVATANGNPAMNRIIFCDPPRG